LGAGFKKITPSTQNQPHSVVDFTLLFDPK